MGIPLAPPPSQTPPTGDQANAVITQAFTATGTSAAFSVYGDFNFALWGTFSGTVKVQKTFDGGTTYIDAMLNNGTVASFTGAGAISLYEPERGVSYIANCTTYASGTIHARFSASGLMAQSEGWR